MKKKKLLEVYIIYFSQSEFIKSVLLLSFLNLKALHFSVILKKPLHVIELLLGTESNNNKHDIPGL